MIIRHLTLQKTLATTILLIGAICIALVISTDITYRDVAYQQQTDAINKLIEIKSSDLIKKLSERQKQLGIGIQNEPGFKNAYREQKSSDASYWLDQEFNRYFVTIGLIKLEKVIVYDRDFKIFASSERGLDVTSIENPPCTGIIRQISKLSNIERTKPRSQLCEFNKQPLLTTVISIGSIKADGYIQIITDPAHILTQVETELGIPVKIHNVTTNYCINLSPGHPANSLVISLSVHMTSGVSMTTPH